MSDERQLYLSKLPTAEIFQPLPPYKVAARLHYKMDWHWGNGKTKEEALTDVQEIAWQAELARRTKATKIDTLRPLADILETLANDILNGSGWQIIETRFGCDQSRERWFVQLIGHIQYAGKSRNGSLYDHYEGDSIDSFIEQCQSKRNALQRYHWVYVSRICEAEMHRLFFKAWSKIRYIRTRQAQPGNILMREDHSRWLLVKDNNAQQETLTVTEFKPGLEDSTSWHISYHEWPFDYHALSPSAAEHWYAQWQIFRLRQNRLNHAWHRIDPLNAR